jgi:hypothetical protein
MILVCPPLTENLKILQILQKLNNIMIIINLSIETQCVGIFKIVVVLITKVFLDVNHKL